MSSFVAARPFLRAVLALGALLQASASLGAEPLTLPAAQRRAGGRARVLGAQDASVTASREMAVAAGQLPDPVLKLGIDNLPLEGAEGFSLTRDFMTMRRVGVMQEVTRAEKRQIRSERFEREAERTLAEKGVAVAQIARDAALAWLDRWYAEAMSGQLAEQVQLAGREIEAAESAYRSGRGSQADVIAAQSMLAQLRDRGSEITKRMRTAQTALVRWVPEAADLPLAGLPDVDALAVPAHALDAHIARHPEIAVLAKQEEIAATDARLAQSAKQSDWTWELSFQQRGPGYSSMVSIGLSIPLQWDQARRQDRETAAKLAMVDEARARREETVRTHVAELKAMLVDWESGRERRLRYQRELLPLAANRTEALLSAYRTGRASLADVLAAERNEADVKLQLLQLELEIARAWAQITFLIPPDTAVAATGYVAARKELP
jgi:outer membrane protein TolC